MPVTIENLTDRPVLLTLSSGETLRLAPGQRFPGLEDVEVKNNPKVDKLVMQRVVAIHGSAPAGAQAVTAQTAGGEADQAGAAADQERRRRSRGRE
jgi:hypothetical protein